ncbi:MAG: thioredoxin domain-containing protein [Bacteroidales bacterium]|jgi:uncharacterized protein YyaL (SSP411 family)|nr:thioredoxin domain-containing protein [Bacteroidales bacterium]NLM92576.1 thioredoxin domain-containing protein [Bacteroidales bacterium]
MKDISRKPNHLEGQTSPYLLQHLYNPVDWHPWGEEALALARRENKPLLVSIGYSACHWCHVMEQESFEDSEVARLMNQYFVCIKVDREEHPDVDHLYMNAVQMITGQGGWPLNCFALPDGKPFWGGTYFPSEQWKNILIRLAELFLNRHSEVEDQADQIIRGIADSSFIKINEGSAAFGRDEVKAMYDNLMGYMDKEKGGTRAAPKFPLPNNYEFLLHYHYQTGDRNALDQVSLSLSKMAMGGIYDQIGGGFSRYATDAEWKVPHFEKMLYDNAQLISLYANAFKVEPVPLFRQVVADTIGFVKRELTSPGGLFFSALDADSDGEEGKYYLWTEQEFEQLLKEDAPLMKAYYHLGGKGLWEQGRNILLREESDEAFASRHSLDVAELNRRVALANTSLLAARSLRTMPGLDDKILVSWNAMMIKGLADAYAAFDEQTYLNMGRDAMETLLKTAAKEDGGLYRNLKGDKPSIPAFLEDYAWVVSALVRLFEVSAEDTYLTEAARITEYALSAFQAEDTSLLAFSARGADKLAAPYFEFHDNVIPSSNSVMARNLFYLAHYFERPDWGQRSSEMLRDMQRLLNKYSSSYSNWGMLLLHHTFPFHSLVVCGEQAKKEMDKVLEKYLPNALLAFSDNTNTKIPVFGDRFKAARTWYYVCLMGACKLPVETLEEALAQLKE